MPGIWRKKTGKLSEWALGVIQHCHESKVHVQLLVAMKERGARIVSHKVNFYGAIRLYEHRILHDSARVPAVHLGEFKDMPVEMKGMRVVTLVVKNHTVASPGMNDQWIGMRK